MDKKILFPLLVINIGWLLVFLYLQFPITKVDSVVVEDQLFNQYFSDVDLTNQTKKSSSADVIYKQEESEYLVFLYPNSCDCRGYLNTLQEYRKLEDSYPIYGVKIDEVFKQIKSSNLQINPNQPEIIHIKNRKEIGRMVGSFRLEGLPKNNSKIS